MTVWRIRLLMLGVVLASGVIAIGWFGYHAQLALQAEQQAYLALLVPVGTRVSWNEVVVLSSPSTCEVDKNNERVRAEFEPGLLEEFASANSASAVPVDLKSLEGRAPVIDLADAERIDRAGGPELVGWSGKRVISLSRAAVKSTGRQVLICVTEYGGRHRIRHFYQMEEVDGVWEVRRAVRHP